MSKLDFIDLADGVRFVDAPTAIGVVTNGSRAALVDTGLDENLVRKVLNHLQDEGLTVEAIVNSHAHADHFGGNAFALKRSEAEVWAPEVEHAFMEHPQFEPHTLFGAIAPGPLTSKWLQAEPSPVHHVVRYPDDGKPAVHEIIGLEWKFHSLPGHSPGQAAIEVEGAVFLSDALLPESILEKYGIVFAVDAKGQRESAQRVPAIGASAYQSYHGGVVEDVHALVDANVRALDASRDAVVTALEDGPLVAEDVFHRVAEHYGWKLSVPQHALNFATVRAHLSALEREGRVRCEVDGVRLLWRLA